MDLGWFVAALVLAVASVAIFFMWQRPVAPPEQQALEGVSHLLGQLQAELTHLSRHQEDLRQDLNRAREASVVQFSDLTQGLRGEITQAHKTLVEMKALEQGRTRQIDQATESLRRLEAVVAGSSTRGVAGENILIRALSQLPPDLLELNVAFGNKVVEYVLRLPGGRVMPIDSKWTSVAELERLDAAEIPQDRKRLTDHILRDLRTKVREMSKYLDPERTMGLALLAVPDAVYTAAPEAHAEGYREGVLVVPYSLALPYVLALYRLTLRFGCTVDADQLMSRLRSLEETLRKVEEEVEGRLSKSLVQIDNSRTALRGQIGEARRVTSRLLDVAGSEAPSLSEAHGRFHLHRPRELTLFGDAG